MIQLVLVYDGGNLKMFYTYQSYKTLQAPLWSLRIFCRLTTLCPKVIICYLDCYPIATKNEKCRTLEVLVHYEHKIKSRRLFLTLSDLKNQIYQLWYCKSLYFEHCILNHCYVVKVINAEMSTIKTPNNLQAKYS